MKAYIQYIFITLITLQPFMHADENFISSVNSWFSKNLSTIGISVGIGATFTVLNWFMIKQNNKALEKKFDTQMTTKVDAGIEELKKDTKDYIGNWFSHANKVLLSHGTAIQQLRSPNSRTLPQGKPMRVGIQSKDDITRID